VRSSKHDHEPDEQPFLQPGVSLASPNVGGGRVARAPGRGHRTAGGGAQPGSNDRELNEQLHFQFSVPPASPNFGGGRVARAPGGGMGRSPEATTVN
jgi:hypothetical protein